MTDIANPEDVLQVAAGDVVASKYRVERVLGQGAMGIVVAARHEELGQKVAIKLLHPDVSVSDEGRERFLREARAAAKLESDHVARVFDVGTFGNKNAYMVMEHLEGSDLEKYLDANGPLPIDEAVDYVLEALEALAHAHAHGMVHRDIKPSNLFLVQRIDGTRRVKILDFGISKTESGLGVSSPGSSTLTSPHAVLGSPAYMAPEQIRSSKHVDQRADIWSVGVLLYELVTGKSPFLGESVGDTLARVLVGQAEPLTVVRPDAPKELADIISMCLEMDEKKRYQTVAELAKAIAPLSSSRTKDLPQRISRVLVANAVLPPPRAIVPSDPNVRVNVAAETLAVAETRSAIGTQITATSSGMHTESARSPRQLVALAVMAIVAVVVVLLVMRRPESDIRTPASNDRPLVTEENPSKLTLPGAPTSTTAASPQIVPVVAPEGSASPPLNDSAKLPASSAPSDVATAPSAHSSSAKPIGKPAGSDAKKTPSNPNPNIPSGLLDGRN